MKTPSIITSMDRPVNLLRATTTCNAFYIFLSAAKASLLPFLTLFFRIINLSAMDTGIIMAAKTLTGFVWAPLWARCAVSYNKRRVVLMFSLLMMAAMYMSFTAVSYKVGKLQMCELTPVHNNHDGNASYVGSSSSDENATPSTGYETGVPQPVQPTNASVSSHTGVGKINITMSDNTNSEVHTDTTQPTNMSGLDVNKSITEVTQIPTTKLPEEKTSTSPTHLPTSPVGSSSTAGPTSSQTTSVPKSNFENLEKLITDEYGSSALVDVVQKGISVNDLYREAKALFPREHFKKNDIQKLINKVKSSSATSHPVTKRSLHRVARRLNITILNNLKDGFDEFTDSLKEKQLLLFLIVLLIVIFGEFFSSPVEKVADDAWFDFLERIDDMEKYGRQRYWGSLTFALVPIIVTCIVDYTPCKMLFGMHHFLMHFVVFFIFMVFTLLVALYFPMPPPIKHKYTSKVAKGLRVICCDVRGVLFVVSLLVAGAVYSSFSNFLFWHLQDLGSQEVTMGLCVSIAAFAETPMLVFSNKLVRKLGHAGVVSLSLAVLAVRVLFYGFLWTPWAVLPAEITNAFTHTALWYAVLSYEEFNVGSAMDRSIRSILSSMYFGLGFSLGSLVSGAVYFTYGAPALFWGASVLSGSWCLVYSLIQCCLPRKERVRYIKLLRKEDDDSTEGEDDWLEMALKDQ